MGKMPMIEGSGAFETLCPIQHYNFTDHCIIFYNWSLIRKNKAGYREISHRTNPGGGVIEREGEMWEILKK